MRNYLASTLILIYLAVTSHASLAQDFNINDLALDQRIDGDNQATQAEQVSKEASEDIVRINDQIYSLNKKQELLKSRSYVTSKSNNYLLNASAALNFDLGVQRNLLIEAINLKKKADSVPSNYAYVQYNFADFDSTLQKNDTVTNGTTAGLYLSFKNIGLKVIPTFTYGYGDVRGPVTNFTNSYSGNLILEKQVWTDQDTNTQEPPQNDKPMSPYSALFLSSGLKYKSADSTKELPKSDQFTSSETYEVAPNIRYAYQASDKLSISVLSAYALDYVSANARGNTNSGTFNLTNREDYTLFKGKDDPSKKLSVFASFGWNSLTNQKTSVGVNPTYQNWLTVGTGVNYQITSAFGLKANYSYDAFNTTFEQHRVTAELDYNF